MRISAFLAFMMFTFSLVSWGKIIDEKNLKSDPLFLKRQSSIEQMVTFVNRAAEDVKKSRVDAFKEFNKSKEEKGKYQEGELYIYAYDFAGINLAHGAKPVLIGKNLMSLKDKQGNFLIQELTEVAKKGSGFVEFFWENPTDKKLIQRKLGYVKKVDETCYVGSGIYFGE